MHTLPIIARAGPTIRQIEAATSDDINWETAVRCWRTKLCMQQDLLCTPSANSLSSDVVKHNVPLSVFKFLLLLQLVSACGTEVHGPVPQAGKYQGSALLLAPNYKGKASHKSKWIKNASLPSM